MIDMFDPADGTPNSVRSDGVKQPIYNAIGRQVGGLLESSPFPWRSFRSSGPGMVRQGALSRSNENYIPPGEFRTPATDEFIRRNVLNPQSKYGTGRKGGNKALGPRMFAAGQGLNDVSGRIARDMGYEVGGAAILAGTWPLQASARLAAAAGIKGAAGGGIESVGDLVRPSRWNSADRIEIGTGVGMEFPNADEYWDVGVSGVKQIRRAFNPQDANDDWKRGEDFASSVSGWWQGLNSQYKPGKMTQQAMLEFEAQSAALPLANPNWSEPRREAYNDAMIGLEQGGPGRVVGTQEGWNMQAWMKENPDVKSYADLSPKRQARMRAEAEKDWTLNNVSVRDNSLTDKIWSSLPLVGEANPTARYSSDRSQVARVPNRREMMYDSGVKTGVMFGSLLANLFSPKLMLADMGQNIFPASETFSDSDTARDLFNFSPTIADRRKPRKEFTGQLEGAMKGQYARMATDQSGKYRPVDQPRTAEQMIGYQLLVDSAGGYGKLNERMKERFGRGDFDLYADELSGF